MIVIRLIFWPIVLGIFLLHLILALLFIAIPEKIIRTTRGRKFFLLRRFYIKLILIYDSMGIYFTKGFIEGKEEIPLIVEKDKERQREIIKDEKVAEQKKLQRFCKKYLGHEKGQDEEGNIICIRCGYTFIRFVTVPDSPHFICEHSGKCKAPFCNCKPKKINQL